MTEVIQVKTAKTLIDRCEIIIELKTQSVQASAGDHFLYFVSTPSIYVEHFSTLNNKTKCEFINVVSIQKIMCAIYQLPTAVYNIFKYTRLYEIEHSLIVFYPFIKL